MKKWLTSFVKLTKKEYFADFFITPPITLGLVIYSLVYSFSIYWIPLFITGWFFWTLYEYVIHRWVSHEFWVFKDLHFLHHKNQKEYIGLPPYITLGMYLLFWLLFGIHSTALMIGFSVGYIFYSSLHTYFHYGYIRQENVFYNSKQRHVSHHRYDDVYYGVSVSWWDKLFGTEKA